MATVRAVRIREPGGPDVLELGQSEVREPGRGEVRVRVAATGLNRADVAQRRGKYPAPPGVAADIPGLEYAGTVEAVGEGVTAVRTGERVMGIAAGGAMTESLLAHERTVMPVPEGLSLEQAAAIPEAFLTAYDALFVQSELSLGQTALLHAVASGVGTAALQLTRLAGATAVGTSRSQDKLSRCRTQGLEHAVLVEEGKFADAVKTATGGRGADVVLDLVGPAYLEENLRAVASQGRIVVVGRVSGAEGTLPVGRLMGKRARITGTLLRSRPLEEKALLTQRFARNVLPLFDAGKLAPVLDPASPMPMSEVQEAHRRMEANETFAKLVLTW